MSAGAGSHLNPLLERLYTLGLFSSSASDRVPSFWMAALPPLLAHLHPETSSPLPPYQATFLPRLLRSLSASTFAGVVEALFSHLARHIDQLDPDTPSETVKRAALVLEDIIGKATTEGEALEAVTRTVMKAKCRMSDAKVHFQLRVAAAWAESGGVAGMRWTFLTEDELTVVVKSLLDTVVDAWTDPKYIRYALYSQQFGALFNYVGRR